LYISVGLAHARRSIETTLTARGSASQTVDLPVMSVVVLVTVDPSRSYRPKRVDQSVNRFGLRKGTCGTMTRQGMARTKKVDGMVSG
jgi:hypothetical protein